MIGLATILLVIYLVLLGLQNSISDSWYKKKHLRWLFFLTLTVIGVIVASETKDLKYNYIFYLSAIGTWLVAVSPNFKTKGLAKILHFTGAGMIVLFGYLGIVLEYGVWVYSLIFLILSGLTYWLVPKCKMYWFEIVAFSGLIGFLNSVL